MKTFMSQVMLGAVAICALSVISRQQASATGGTCITSRLEREIWGPNSYAVRASCSYLQSTTKARGILDISGEPDMQTSWFITLNKYYVSDYYRCTFSCNNTFPEYGIR